MSCQSPIEHSLDQEVELRSLNSPCPTESEINCNGQEIVVNITAVDIELPSYPGCLFTVSFTRSWCPLAGNDVIDIIDPMITSHNCPDYSDDLNTAMLGGEVPLFTFMQNIDEELGIVLITWNLLDINDPSHNCGPATPPEVVVNLIEASCYAICVQEFPSTLLSSSKLLNGVKVRCGSVCCRTGYWACLDPTTNQAQVSLNSPPRLTGTAECGNTPIGNYARNCIFFTECEEVCE